MTRLMNRLEQRIERIPPDIQQAISEQLDTLEASIQQLSVERPRAQDDTVSAFRANLESAMASLGETLGDRIAQLDATINDVSNDLRAYVAGKDKQVGPSDRSGV